MSKRFITTTISYKIFKNTSKLTVRSGSTYHTVSLFTFNVILFTTFLARFATAGAGSDESMRRIYKKSIE